MSNGFFQRLFAGAETQWALHTTYTCDLDYLASLSAVCSPDSNGWSAENTAVFYDRKRPLRAKGRGTARGVVLGELKCMTHPLANEERQTFHAKLSLICYRSNGGERGYRLAVYSKNMEFTGGCNDAALLFELECGEQETESGRQLAAYLDKLRDSTDDTGKSWLKEHIGKDVLEQLKKSTLHSEFGIDAELFFGGCGGGESLGKRLDLHGASTDGIVLTPPAFLEGHAAKFFKDKRGPLLYDLVSQQNNMAVSSHIKLYLLKKPKGHELWVGSANATSRGLGWPGAKSYCNDDTKASVECLVKFNLTASEFSGLKNGIINAGYAAFSFAEGAEGSLKVKDDQFGPWMCENFVVTDLKYKDTDDNDCSPRSAKKLTVYLECRSGASLTPPEGNRIWRPAEYSDEAEIEPVGPDISELTYPFTSFRPSQGILVFGTSCSIMEIPGKLLENIPTVKKTVGKDTRLSDWLLSAQDLEDAADAPLPEELGRFRQLLLEAEGVPAPPLPENWDDKATPMQFQENAASRMVKILRSNSRVFLADEAGLGKTYSTAAAVCKMAQEQWEDEEKERKKPTPFFCLYVAPNKALLNKCAEDFRSKGAALLNKDEGENIIVLSRSKKEALRQLLRECEKDVRSRKGRWQRRNLEKLTEGSKSLEEYSENDLSGMKPRNFIRNTFPKSWQDIANTRLSQMSEPDRLVYHDKLLTKHEPSGKTIVLLRVSVGCLLDDSTATDEKGLLGGASRAPFTEHFLKQRQVQAIIWDEFHRYTTKLNGNNPVYQVICEWEKDSHVESDHPLRSIFLSATPYRTNISGAENREALDRLYQLGDEKEEKIDKLTGLPEFPAFAALFCDGWSEKSGLSCDDLKKSYDAFVSDPGGKNTRDNLKNILQKRMIRHERTLLQGELEQHLRLYPPEELYAEQYGPVLQNTMRQSHLLENGGFSKGDCRWSLSVPWILSFFKKKDDNGGEQRLDPVEKTFVPELFVYDNNHEYIPDRLRTLPQQNLPFYEMCRQNLDGEMTQLLWVPPTVPLYRPGEDSIFSRYRDYSKLLVFAEYHYYQKGGALLLSDYAHMQNSTGGSAPDKLPELDFAGMKLPTFDLTGADRRNTTLDELIAQMQHEYPGFDTVSALAMIAAPAVCAHRLGLDPRELEEAFNAYFNRNGVRQALWKWLCANDYSDKTRLVEGILRYCAEGNLYAVLEEWCFIAKKDTDTSLTAQLCELLKPGAHFAKVTVSSYDDLSALASGKSPQKEDKLRRRECSFADRLTGDTDDVGSGDNDAVIAACANRFSSPFWPMVMFAGRGAQEGMDFHQYCLRIMHLTIPRGAVSFDQRNGRIDRYRSLLVRRRAAEWFRDAPCEGGSGKMLARMFYHLTDKSGYGALRADPDDQLFPNWHIPAKYSRHHFEQLFPVWPFTEEYAALKICDAMLESYRRPFGSSPGETETVIDLSAPPAEK